MTAHHVLQGTEFPPIHTQVLHNWRIDHQSLDLYRIKPRNFAANVPINEFPYQFHNVHDLDNKWLTSVIVTSLLSLQSLEVRTRLPEAAAVLNSLHEEADSPSLPLVTDDEANYVRKFIAPNNPTLAKYEMHEYFPDTKLRPMHTSDLRLLHHVLGTIKFVLLTKIMTMITTSTNYAFSSCSFIMAISTLIIILSPKCFVVNPV